MPHGAPLTQPPELLLPGLEVPGTCVGCPWHVPHPHELLVHRPSPSTPPRPKRPSCAKGLALGSLNALIAVALAPVSLGQRVMVPHNRPHASVALVNIGAGALVDGVWIDVQASGIPTPGNSELVDAERVGDEAWIASSFWIYRYAVNDGRAFISSFHVDAQVRSLEFQPDVLGGRVLVTTTDSIRVFRPDATEIGHMPIGGAGDTLEIEGGMLVAIQDENRIDRYTLGGQWLCTFAGPAVPTTLGILSEPRQLSRRRNGNILVAGDVRVYEFTSEGLFIDEYDVGPFEGGVIESVSERLFVPLQNGVAIYDAASRRSTHVGGLYFGQGRRVGYFDDGSRSALEPGDWSSAVTCRGAAHSGADRARVGILGSPQLRERTLALFVDHLPQPSHSILMLAPRYEFTEVGAAGNLCLHRDSLIIAGDPEPADEFGQALFQLVRGPEGHEALFPGSTWFAQALFRDGSSFRLSSAMKFTLMP